MNSGFYALNYTEIKFNATWIIGFFEFIILFDCFHESIATIFFVHSASTT